MYDYLLADGWQPVEAITGRFESDDALPGAAETSVVHAHRGAPGGGRLVARRARGGGAPRRGQRRAARARARARAARRRHDQRHVGRALLHAAAAPALSPEPAVLRRLQVLTFQHGSLERRHRLQQSDCRVLHRCTILVRRHLELSVSLISRRYLGISKELE